MKKFIIFGYDEYYPNGGASDIIGYANSIEEALQVANNNQGYNYIDILDIEKEKEVEISKDYAPGGLTHSWVLCESRRK